MDLSKCIYGSSISSLSLYVQQYNKLPSLLTLTYNGENDNCDIEKLSDDLIHELFDNVTSIRREIAKYTRNNIEVNDQLDVVNGGTSVTISTSDNKIFRIDCNSINCLYNNVLFSDIENFCRDVWKKLPKEVEEKKEQVVKLVGFGDGDYYTLSSKVRKVDVNIEENYNDDFLPVHNDIISFLDSRESGLILLFGVCGSGKSSYIRNLCCNHPADYIIVPTSLTGKLGDPDFVSFMLDNSDSVFILEDCEQILMDRNVNLFNGAISNILNMSDGLLSDIMNIKFICTFNADIKSIDSALLRKGRCYAKYEFKELTEDKVRNLNDKYNLGIEDIKPMTLAEIYNADKTEYKDTKKKRIGF